MNTNLNQKQLDLLKLLAECPATGAIIYGRGPTATVQALAQRGLCAALCETVNVVSMNRLERRTLWGITTDGVEAVRTHLLLEVRS